MPSKRIMPQWLAFLVPISLSFAVLATIGCGDNEHKEPPAPPAPPSAETGLQSLVVNQGILTPAFNANIKDYTLTDTPIIDPPGGITITATLKDTRAKLYIDEVQRTSGQPVVFPYPAGVDTKFWIKVVGEDNRYIDSTWLTINRRPLNTSIYVIEGFGGPYVPDAAVTLTDTEGNVLLEDFAITEARQGKPVFALDPERKYNLYATGRTIVSSAMTNFDPSMENTAKIYGVRGPVSLDYGAPIITDISLSTTNANGGPWTTVYNLDSGYNNNHVEDIAANMVAVRVTAISQNQIGTGYGQDAAYTMRINVDEVASGNSGGATGATGTVIENSVAHPGGYYRSQHRFAITPTLQTSTFNKDHWLDVVVYDIGGNRTEQRVYLTVTNSAPNATGDPNISAISPNFTVIRAETYGMYQPLPGVADVNGHGSLLTVVGNFTVNDGSNRAIRGYEVERAIGAPIDFQKIMTVNYSTTDTTATKAFTDRTPGIEVGVPNYYRVRAFNGNPANRGFTQYSNIRETIPMPPWVVKADYIVSPKIWPTFRFRISDPTMVNYDDLGMMRFLIYLKGKEGNYPLMIAPFRVNFANRSVDDAWGVGKPTFEMQWVTGYTGSSGALTGATWYQATYPDVDENGNPINVPWAYLEDDGTFVVETDNDVFQGLIFNAASYLDMFGNCLLPGASYEYGIFGERGGVNNNNGVGSINTGAATNNPYFQTASINATGGTPLAYSYGSHSDFGYVSPEGFFVMTIAADAD